ncbi:MAG: CoA-binding protein [Chloroflexota bacterium]
MSDTWTTLFEPRSVAVIGASTSPGKPGHEVIRNMQANGYEGRIHLVNPKGGEILGLPVETGIESLPDGIDLAIVIVPAAATTEAVRRCAAKGIKTFVLAAGGYSEVDEHGEELQRELEKTIKDLGVRAIGPNTSGNISTPHKFTSSFFPLGWIRPGNISYITQTGNFATHTQRYITSGEYFGTCRVIGLGNKIDIDETEALEYLANDPETKAIFLYLESLKRPREFLKTARKAAAKKAVFMLKGGTSAEGSAAAIAHTAALASDARIIEAALHQSCVTQLTDYSQLFHVAKAVSPMPLPRGNRVSFLAPSGAMLVVLTDLCRQRWDLVVPDLLEKNRQRLQDIGPNWLRMRNPVDIWGPALVHGIEKSHRLALEAVLDDPNIDAVVVVLVVVDDLGRPDLDFLVDTARKYPEKPLYVTFSGIKERMDEAKAYLEPRGVPTYPFIEQPFEVLSILARTRKLMDRAQQYD